MVIVIEWCSVKTARDKTSPAYWPRQIGTRQNDPVKIAPTTSPSTIRPDEMTTDTSYNHLDSYVTNANSTTTVACYKKNIMLEYN